MTRERDEARDYLGDLHDALYRARRKCPARCHPGECAYCNGRGYLTGDSPHFAMVVEGDNAAFKAGTEAGRSGKWLVVRKRDVDPVEVYAFNSEADAIEFYDRAQLQWSECFLAAVVQPLPTPSEEP